MTEKNKRKLELKERRKPKIPMFRRTKTFAEKKLNLENKHKNKEMEY